jgi:hypothetical protein
VSFGRSHRAGSDARSAAVHSVRRATRVALAATSADGSVTTGTLALNTWGQLELHVITTGANTSTVAGS